MAVDAQTIRDYVAANIDNPKAIAKAAEANGVSVADIASAMSLPTDTVNNFFTSANVPPPTLATVATVRSPASILNALQNLSSTGAGAALTQIQGLQNQPTTTAPAPTPTTEPTPSTPVATTPTAPTKPALPEGSYINPSTGHLMQPTGNLNDDGSLEYLDVTGTEINKAGGGGGGLFSLENIIKIGLAYALPIVGEAIALELGTSAAVGTALAAVGTGVAQGQDLNTAIQNAAPALIASGIMSQVDISNLTGQISSDPSLQNAINNIANSTATTALKGGSLTDIVQNAVATGGGTLIGQSLTPSLGTLGASTVGQALATGAVTGNALSGLTAGAGTAGGLQATQNSYMRDIDSVLNSQASGAPPQKVSLDFVDLSQGTQVAGPGGLPNDGFKPGQMTQTASGLFATIKLTDGTIVNVPVQYNQGANSLTTNSTNPEIINQVKLLQVTPENITKINPVFLDKTPVNPNITPEEQAALNKVSSARDNMINALKSGKSIDEYYNTYAYQQSLGDLASQIADELAKDPTGVDPSYDKMRAEYQKITGTAYTLGTSSANIPEIIIIGKVIRSDPSTGTSTVQTPDGVTINVSSVLPQNTNVSVNKTTNTVIPTSVTNQTAATDTSPVSKLDTTTTPTSNVSTSNVTITSGGTNNASNIRSNVGTNLSQNIINLLSPNTSTNTASNLTSNVTTTTPTSNVVISGGGGNNVGNVTITGGPSNNTRSNIANVTITGGTANNIATVIPSTPSANVTITGGVANNAVSNVSDNNVSITTSYVPTKTKSLYPTIVGQFTNPVTQAVSAYRPPGDIESQATGKEREDVWNTESLRNALGI